MKKKVIKKAEKVHSRLPVTGPKFHKEEIELTLRDIKFMGYYGTRLLGKVYQGFIDLYGYPVGHTTFNEAIKNVTLFDLLHGLTDDDLTQCWCDTAHVIFAEDDDMPASVLDAMSTLVGYHECDDMCRDNTTPNNMKLDNI
jgi:hypothetical protein